MGRSLKYLAFVLCCSSAFISNGQDTLYTQPDSPYKVDSSYVIESTPGVFASKEFGYFDTTPKIEERKINEEALNQVRNDDAYWYANMEVKPKKKKEVKKEIKFRGAEWFDSLFWILLIGGFVALLIWLLSSSNISLFRKTPDVIDDMPEEGGENIFEVNFDKEIQAAVDSKNYRLGIRMMYLQVLRMMADRGLISYTAEKTNSDYIHELAGTKYYKDFSRLTRNFDFVWYGKFPLSPEAFELMKKDFTGIKQLLR